MKIKVKLFANFREAAKKKEVEVSLDGDRVADVIFALIHDYPQLQTMMLNDTELKPYVNILQNGKSARDSARVNDGDEIAIFPPVSGG